MDDYLDPQTQASALQKLAIAKSLTPQIARKLMVEGITTGLITIIIDIVLHLIVGSWRPYVWLPLIINQVYQNRSDADYMQGLEMFLSIMAITGLLCPPFVGDYNLFLSLDFFSFTYRHIKMTAVLMDVFGADYSSLHLGLPVPVWQDHVKNGPWAVVPVYRFVTGVVVLAAGWVLAWVGLL
jgi:hypothetical protein